MDVTDRVVGCLLGLAVGDSLGAPFEFMRAGEIPKPLPAFERSWMGLAPGSTTDDTAMARNLSRSLAERGEFDPDDVVARHVGWMRSGPPDIGSLTKRVLQRVSEGTRAEEAAEALWQLRGPEASAGNGSVMYCAPLGAAYAQRPQRLERLAPKLSALTHYDGRCRTSVLVITLCVAALVRGDPAIESARSALEAGLAHEGGEELEFLVEAIDDTRAIDGPEQGFCLYAAGAGLQALTRGGDAREELTRIVGLGGDTDTNAAVAGALIGARDGLSGLPGDWLSMLVEREAIEAEARALVGPALTSA